LIVDVRRIFAVIAILLARPAWGEEPTEPGDDEEIGDHAVRTATAWKPIHYYHLIPADRLAAELAARHRAGGTVPVLLERVTRGLVGAPYLRSPLGEAAPPDRDPRFRLDAFDCTTFVETALALAKCDDLEEVKDELEKLRYRRAPGWFIDRRHLIEAQWIPDLVAAGWVVDITKELGGKAAKTVTVEITKASWAKRRIAKDLSLPDTAVPYGTYRLAVLPLDVLGRRDVVIPVGTIVNVVRVEVPWSPTLVSHQGIVLEGPNGRFVRHASPVLKRVVDEPYERFVARYIKPRTPKKWKVLGLNVLRVR
jgi:hypothetical protein